MRGVWTRRHWVMLALAASGCLYDQCAPGPAPDEPPFADEAALDLAPFVGVVALSPAGLCPEATTCAKPTHGSFQWPRAGEQIRLTVVETWAGHLAADTLVAPDDTWSYLELFTHGAPPRAVVAFNVEKRAAYPLCGLSDVPVAYVRGARRAFVIDATDDTRLADLNTIWTSGWVYVDGGPNAGRGFPKSYLRYSVSDARTQAMESLRRSPVRDPYCVADDSLDGGTRCVDPASYAYRCVAPADGGLADAGSDSGGP